MQSASRARSYDPVELPVERSEHYGGMVGDLLSQIEERLTAAPADVADPAVRPRGPDLAHRVSVAAGYTGLAMGFVATGYFIGWIV